MGKCKPLEEYIRESNIVHNNRYDYSLAHLDFKNGHSKIKIICPEHGVFEQSFDKHIFRKHGCTYCGTNKRKTTEEFIIDARKIHGNAYNYGLVEYKNAHTKIKIICPKHGIFEQTPNSHLGGNGCRICRGEKLSESQRIPQETIINKLKELHPEYDYSKVHYINIKTKIKIICPEHGEFVSSPENLLIGRGCPKCGIAKVADALRKPKEEFIADAKRIHGNKYDYSLVKYINRNTKVKIICPLHGMFEQSPTKHLKNGNCPRCTMSQGEEKITVWLNNHGYINNKDYYPQKRFKELGCRSYDFYIPSKNLLIEYNGAQHYIITIFTNTPEKLKEQRHSDWIKRKFARDNNIELLVIKYTEFNRIEEILENKIGTLNKSAY